MDVDVTVVVVVGILVPRKQEHPLNSAVGFSVQWDTNVGVEAVEVVVVATGTVRLNWTFSSREATVVVAVTVAVIIVTMDKQYELACAEL